MKINPKVSIIILNWNNLKDTAECLESVQKLDYQNFDIIVVDNGSIDGSPGKIQKLFPHVSLIRNKENLGYAGGNNAGIKYALDNGAECVWLLNNDTIIEATTLGKLVAYAWKSPNAGLLSPLIYYHSKPEKLQFCGAYFNWKKFSAPRFEDLNEKDRSGDRQIMIWGTALFIKREVINTVGYFNEKYFAYWEDADYSLRTLKAGYINATVDDAKILHKINFLDKSEVREKGQHYFYYMTRNEYWFFYKNVSIFRRIVFFRRYILDLMGKLIRYKKMGNYEAINGTLDGLYCALLNIGGAWNDRVKMPRVLKKIILSHPYFYTYILEFNFKKIAESFFNGLRQKIVKIGWCKS